MNWQYAYDNSHAVTDSAALIERAAQRATETRQRHQASAQLDLAYGEHPRQRLDLFLPRTQSARALLVHVHGGYWMRTDKSNWSHCVEGALAQGLAVAVPSYRLCPEVSIASISADVASAIAFAAAKVRGTIVLSGHSAGGHLVARQLCQDSTVSPDIRKRIRAALSISGLHDLRPLIKTPLNTTLQLSQPTARAESPALLDPLPEAVLYAWVGANELPELRRQTQLIGSMWFGLASATSTREVSDQHHFDIIDALEDPDSAMLNTLLAHC